MARVTGPSVPADTRKEVNGPHTCVHESNWRSTRAGLEKQQEIISLLLTLEPGLDKYREDDPNWGHRVWDVDGMKAALEFKRLQEAHEKYATLPVVSETTTEKTKDR